MFVNFNILNQLGSPAINSNTFANRPAAGQTGRLFVSTDTFEIYRDNGTTWDLIGGPGSSTITGTGTANYITKFTGSQSIGNSIMTEGIGLITITGTDPRFVVGGTDDTSSQLQTYSNVQTRWKFQVSSNTATDDADITGYRTRGTVAAPTAILAGDNITNYSGRGYDGTNFLGGAGIDIFAEENYTPVAAGTYLILQTTSIGAIIESEKARLTANGFFGIGTNTPLGLLHVDGGASAARMILDADSGVAKIFSFRTDALPRWAFRVDGAETGSNAGANLSVRSYDDAGAFTFAPLSIIRATGESTFSSTKTYSTGNAIGIAVQHNLTIPNGVNVGVAALGGVNSNLNLTLQGSTTVANTGRQGLEGSTSISFTGAGTLTMTQGSTVRAFSALSSVYAFNGSAVGTITHLAGLRICFPDNVGSAVNITNNYALLINNQTTGTGTVTYTNRWGIYQEGASDLNYFAANTLVGSTTNNGNKLQVTGNADFSGNVGIGTTSPAYKLDVSGNTRIGNFLFNNYNNEILVGVDATGYYIASGAGATNNIPINIGDRASRIVFITSTSTAAGTEKMRLDASGNLGLGVTPSAWDTSFYKAIEGGDVNSQGAIAFNLNGTSNGIDLWSNGYFNGINSIYKFNGTAALYQVAGNIYRWYNAPSGTAGNAISFTQAMTLAANGNLLIGTTTDTGQKLQVNGSGYFANSLTAIQTSTFRATGNGYTDGSIILQNSSGTLNSYLTNAGGGFYISNDGSTQHFLLTSAGNAEIAGSVKTGIPNGGSAGSWKLGVRVAATVVVNTTEYIEVDIGGTLYKLATVT